jgi:hypothetical protein
MAEHHAPALDPHDPRLVEVNDPADIFPELEGTAVADLLRWHNLPGSRGSMPASTARAHLLVSMCMDHRADLVIPNEFAYILRSAGGTLRDSDFEVQYAVAVGGVTEIALLAHTDCGMVGVSGKRAKFVEGLVARGGCFSERGGSGSGIGGDATPQKLPVTQVPLCLWHSASSQVLLHLQMLL